MKANERKTPHSSFRPLFIVTLHSGNGCFPTPTKRLGVSTKTTGRFDQNVKAFYPKRKDVFPDNIESLLFTKQTTDIQMEYKLLALDLDGTLTNSKKQITPHTLETLIRAQQEKGLKIILASGRPTYGVAPLANALQLDKFGGFILAYNGGEIINWRTHEIMYKNLLDHDVLPYLYECAKKNDFAIVTYENEYVLTEKPDDEYVLKEALLNVMKIKKVDNFLEAVRHPIAKCLIVGEPTHLAILEKEMQEQLKDRMGVFRSEPYFLELVPKGIDKARSLSVLLEELELKREELMAAGDGFNDLSMVRFAGMGVAMANAQDVVKENADFITLSNDEDGVAYAVEKFILS